MTINIIQVDLSDKRQVREFIDLPFSIYRDIPQWVPPLLMDERKRLDPQRFPFYKHSEAAFFMAHDGTHPVGRIAVLNNRRYNEFNHESSAFFYLFECEDDPRAANGLFESAFAWARARGLKKIHGPKGFTPLDGFGLLIRGFEYRPAFGLPYNPPYYVPLVEAQGFVVAREAVSGLLDESIKFPPRIHELAERITARRGLRIARYETRADLRKLVPLLKDLYNDALRGTGGNAPVTDEEMNVLADQLLWFADPKLIKVVMKDTQPVGFLLAYPDISAALQKTRGRLFPFGWVTLLRELRSTTFLNLNGAGLIPEYRGSGGTAILYSEMFKTVLESGRYHAAEVVQIGLENANMQREMENFGVNFNKMHRTYTLEL